MANLVLFACDDGPEVAVEYASCICFCDEGILACRGLMDCPPSPNCENIDQCQSYCAQEAVCGADLATELTDCRTGGGWDSTRLCVRAPDCAGVSEDVCIARASDIPCYPYWSDFLQSLAFEGCHASARAALDRWQTCEDERPSAKECELHQQEGICSTVDASVISPISFDECLPDCTFDDVGCPEGSICERAQCRMPCDAAPIWPTTPGSPCCSVTLQRGTCPGETLCLESPRSGRLYCGCASICPDGNLSSGECDS